MNTVARTSARQIEDANLRNVLSVEEGSRVGRDLADVRSVEQPPGRGTTETTRLGAVIARGIVIAVGVTMSAIFFARI